MRLGRLTLRRRRPHVEGDIRQAELARSSDEEAWEGAVRAAQDWLRNTDGDARKEIERAIRDGAYYDQDGVLRLPDGRPFWESWERG